MPTNHYGPGDNFHPENSHVIPGLLRRFHEAVQGGAERVTIWGTGTPRKLLDVRGSRPWAGWRALGCKRGCGMPMLGIRRPWRATLAGEGWAVGPSISN